MTIIRPNSIAGVTSITAQSGSLNFYTSGGGDLPVVAGSVDATNFNITGVGTIATLNSTNVNITSGSITGINTIGVTTVTTSNLTVNGNDYPTAGSLTNRNMIINGEMVINQRGYTSVASTSIGYSVDRWTYIASNDAVVAVGQSTSAAAQPTGQGFTNSLHVRVTTADSSLSASQNASIQQVIEGYNVQGVKKGSPNAESITLSFWVRSTKTGIYIAELYDADNTRQVSKSYTVNVANTWEKKIITFEPDTTGAFDNDNNASLSVVWWLAAGSDFTSGTLNTSWNSTTNINRAVGQVNFLDNVGAQFNITGVQLEAGTVATPFERRSYGQELALCQRYYYRSADSQQNAALMIGGVESPTSAAVSMRHPVDMRATPTITFGSGLRFYSYTTSAITPTINTNRSTTQLAALAVNISGATVGQAAYIFNAPNTNSYFEVSIEL